MIHSDTLKGLTPEEYLLLYAVCNHVVGQMNLVCNPKWIGTFKVDRLIPIIERVNNLKEEYTGVRDSLLEKLRGSSF